MSKETDLKSFKEQSLEIYNLNKPIPAAFQKIKPDAYNALKGKIKNEVFELDFPEINELEKWNVVETLLKKLKYFIDNNHKKDLINNTQWEKQFEL